MLRKIFVWILLTLLVVSCSPALPSLTPTSPEAQATSAPTATAGEKTLPTATTADTSLVLVYQRSGGIMGRSETWKIYADGRIETQPDQGKLQVSAGEVSSLRALLLNMDIASLSKATKAAPSCADCFNISVTVYDAGKEYTYSFTQDGRNTAKEETIAAAFAAFIQNTGVK
jgi:hypothetical protein